MVSARSRAPPAIPSFANLPQPSPAIPSEAADSGGFTTVSRPFRVVLGAKLTIIDENAIRKRRGRSNPAVASRKRASRPSKLQIRAASPSGRLWLYATCATFWLA